MVKFKQILNKLINNKNNYSKKMIAAVIALLVT